MKKTSTVHQPHDKLVKKLLSDPAIARDILSLYLPPEVLSIADLNHLELQRDTFIDDEHRVNAVDLLFKTTLNGEEGYIWILIEHQRKGDPWMPLRLFKYMAIIWDHLRKISKTKSIPLVYPIVIYNGEKPYPYSLNMIDLIEPAASKEIFKTLFTKPFPLIDLALIPDESLRKEAQERIKGTVLLMTLKHAHDKCIKRFLKQTFIKILQQLDRSGDSDIISNVFHYILHENKALTIEQFQSTINQSFSEEVEIKIMTVAQQLREEGREEGREQGIEQGREQGIEQGRKQGIEQGREQGIEQGREQGIEQGKLQTAKQLLTDNKNLSNSELITWIQRMTGLSLEKIQELQMSQ